MVEKRIARVCEGGPLHGEVVEHSWTARVFVLCRMPSVEWPDNSRSLMPKREDRYIAEGDRWVWHNGDAWDLGEES